MSTRSDIIVHRRDGKWMRIYSHWDGYPSHNGAILQAFYNSQERAEELVTPGDISSLAPRCNKPKGHSFDKPKKLEKVYDFETLHGWKKSHIQDGYTVYYGRDRGEAGTEARVCDSLQAAWPEADTLTEYTYIWDGQKWWVGDPDHGSQDLYDLGEALKGGAHPTPLVKCFPGFVIGRHT